MNGSRPPKPSGGGSSLWWDGSPARRAALPCIFPSIGLGKPSSLAPWPDCEPFHSPPDCQPATDPTSPQTRATPVRESSLLRILSPSRASQLPQRDARMQRTGPYAATEDRPPTSNLPQWSPAISPVAPSPTLPLSSRRPSVSLRWIRV